MTVGNYPLGVAVTPDGSTVYVTNSNDGTVSVINTTNNTAYPNINIGNYLGGYPWGVAVTPDGTKIYVTNYDSNTASIINTSTNSIIATIYGLNSPYGVAVTPDRSTVYVTNSGSNTASVINTSTNSIITMVPVGSRPYGVSVTQDGTKAFVANFVDNNVSVIDTTNNTAYPSINVGNGPAAFGQFIPTLIAPIITWSNPADITYGTRLSSTQLDATANVLGSFSYTPTAGTVLSIGQNQPLNVTFTPTDSTNCTTATDTVYINVTQATPTLAWTPNPLSNIVYGTALGADLDATATYNGQTVPGSFAYTEGSTPVGITTVLGVGTHTLAATFTPTNTTIYTSGGTVQNTINVTQPTPTQRTPTLTWTPNPLANMIYGTALGADLNATATDPTNGQTVPGNFVYTDETAAVVNAGTVIKCRYTYIECYFYTN